MYLRRTGSLEREYIFSSAYMGEVTNAIIPVLTLHSHALDDRKDHSLSEMVEEF